MAGPDGSARELDDPRRAAALRLGAALRRPAAALGTTPATLAIAFTLLHPRTAATLVGATTPAQIDAAIDAVELGGAPHVGRRGGPEKPGGLALIGPGASTEGVTSVRSIRIF